MPIILGICGFIGSGKSTFAEDFAAVAPAKSAHLETSTIIVELADAFNAALTVEEAGLFNDVIQVSNKALKNLLPKLSAMSERPLRLSDIAIEQAAAEHAPDWYQKLFAYFAALQGTPDLAWHPIIAANKDRYRALLQWIGGYFLYKLDDPLIWYKELSHRIDGLPETVQFVALTAPRQPAEGNYVQSLGGKVIRIERPEAIGDKQEVTERSINAIANDAIIMNDGSLEQLAACARQVHTDLITDSLKKHYRASGFQFTSA